MLHRIAEIREFLKHGDHSLALRRMLDLALDTGDAGYIRRAIDWSRKWREQQKDGEAMPASFFEDSEGLLASLPSTGTSAQPRSLLLNAKAVAKTYSGSGFSLHPLDLVLHSGEVIGIVGENGNGKTTLLRAISAQLAIDEGSISYPTLQKPDAYAIKHHLAFIPQRIPRWYGELKDNLHFSAAISGLTGANNELMVDFMLERLNLRPFAALTWNQISSGYRTRFEIARILLQRPKLLVLDEPLANLDILAQQTLLTDLRYMATSDRHPMGVLLSSQQLHEVEKIADSVLFIRKGHCLFRTDEQAVVETVVELETTAAREQLAAVFEDSAVQIQYNGGFYTLSSPALPISEMLQKLLASGITPSYFRDITHSTKRFFQS